MKTCAVKIPLFTWGAKPEEPGWYFIRDRGSVGMRAELQRHCHSLPQTVPTADYVGVEFISEVDIKRQEFLHMGIYYRFSGVDFAGRITPPIDAPENINTLESETRG